ncbi:GtrA family protein [Dokdonella sp.]|uniref:GtrA family protein n=1 Tax=Dokdonella sp. TaxID=2291710 RepID=UPI0025BE686F|nr:GtrA family protein [Dokdonella sp.]MBX3692217.1 GtrA family protein [Dokdonella sp.]MCW5568184.1 GtrA family protein [Dokdonella sp.]
MNPDHERADSPSPQSRPLHRIVSEFLRFLVMGGANTIVAYAIYLLLLNWMRYELAYTIGYAVGIAMAYVLSSTFVFRQPFKRRSALRFPFVYIAQFLVSFVLLRIAVEWIGLPEWVALGFAVVATIPVTFALSRWILRAG